MLLKYCNALLLLCYWTSLVTRLIVEKVLEERHVSSAAFWALNFNIMFNFLGGLFGDIPQTPVPEKGCHFSRDPGYPSPYSLRSQILS